MTSADAKICIVTGASRGLGRAIAIALGTRGWQTCVNYLKEADAAAETVDRFKGCGGNAFACRADVRDADAVEFLFEECKRVLGPPTLLVNNAGIARESLILKMKLAEWDEVLATNFRGPLNCCRAAARFMTAGGGIINIASTSGLRGRAGQTHYATAKGALIGLTQSLAVELAPGIRVNAIIPGYLPTQMGLASPGAAEAARNANVFGNLGDVEETARFVADLAELKSVSGRIFSIDARL